MKITHKNNYFKHSLTRRLSITISALGLTLFGTTCGLNEAKYIDYGETVITSTRNCIGAQTAWTNHIAAAIPTSCSSSSCHGEGGAGTSNGFIFAAGSLDNDNRQLLKDFQGGDAEKMWNFLSNHTGAAAVNSSLSQEAIQAWLTAEANCTPDDERP